MPPEVLTSEGQLPIPVEVQKKLGIKAGDRVDVIENDRGEFVLQPKKRSVMDLSGIGKWDGPPVTIEEINETIAKGWAGLLEDDEVDR